MQSSCGLAAEMAGPASRLFERIDEKRHTPSGSLLFLMCCFVAVLTVAVYPFLGWMGLYPVVIGAVVLVFYKKKERKDHKLAV